MINDEQKLIEEAERYIKEHKKMLIERFANPAKYEADDMRISLFMAGSPGAGKTEVSRRLAERFHTQPVIIDADEIRKMCPGYTGTNAHLFQRAATKGVHILYDYVLRCGLNAIIDGTFAYANSMRNIERSITRGRKTELYFVYQDPVQAWEFTKKREALEQRRVSRETFIHAFVTCRKNVHAAKRTFGNALQLNLVIKNIDDGIEQFKLDITHLDDFVNRTYTENELKEIIV